MNRSRACLAEVSTVIPAGRAAPGQPTSSKIRMLMAGGASLRRVLSMLTSSTYQESSVIPPSGGGCMAAQPLTDARHDAGPPGDMTGPVVGVSYPVDWPSVHVPAWARLAETLGYEEVWIAEDC